MSEREHHETPTKNSYPQSVTLGDEQITLRLLAAGDRPLLERFAAELSEHDLLFLRRDITDPSGLDEWLKDAEKKRLTTILALDPDEDRVLGYATIDPSRLSWSAHVAELRVLVAAAARGRGLGRLLTDQAFRHALASGIEKMVARMTLDQKGAIAVFESLGFRPEALLKNHVKDRHGDHHDLLTLSHDVAEFHRTLDGYGVSQAVESSTG